MKPVALKLGVIVDHGSHYWDEVHKHRTRCGIHIRTYGGYSEKVVIDALHAEPTDEPVTCLVCLGAE